MGSPPRFVIPDGRCGGRAGTQDFSFRTQHLKPLGPGSPPEGSGRDDGSRGARVIARRFEARRAPEGGFVQTHASGEALDIAAWSAPSHTPARRGRLFNAIVFGGGLGAPPSPAARAAGRRHSCARGGPFAGIMRQLGGEQSARRRGEPDTRHRRQRAVLMASRIEDYAVIGNGETMALVGLDGSIDWLCLPRFDSPACFAALVGDAENGRWLIAPVDDGARVSRRYRHDTLILETAFETARGAVRVTDFMVQRGGGADIVRLVKGLRGAVAMRTELCVRFDYGDTIPWVRRDHDDRLLFVAGPDRLILDTKVRLQGEGLRSAAVFDVRHGEEIGFALSWSASFADRPPPLRCGRARSAVEKSWKRWASACSPAGEWQAAVMRSLLTLKGLAHRETGGIVAAATTSLPEKIGGARNWDYRYCWLRDATFTLYALIGSGYLEEASAWRGWLLRAIAGAPADLRIMYGVGGERNLSEHEAPHLAGYEGSAPVRIGNAAAGQVQLDVYGEVLDALFVARCAGLDPEAASWALERALLDHLETIWAEPDDGIWEVRGGRRHFTHSKVMAWVAFDRAVRSVETFGLDGPVGRWREIRATIHRQICDRGFHKGRNSFVQSYGSDELDASLLLLAIVGFLPPDDPRIRGTVAAIENDLVADGLVLRYRTRTGADGLPPGEGAFLACSFWLADNYVLQGRQDDGRALFQSLLSLRNDVGLLAEEYDVKSKRQLGNFPQAFSHLALVNTARNLTSPHGPAHHRSATEGARPVGRGAP
ncbi:MAG TPA: glycoside hydrolase family 15 protein [Caulobacteraceae bacterium]